MRPLAFGWPLRIAHACLTNSRATSAVFALSGLLGDGIERRHAGPLRVGVVHVPAEPWAAEHDHEAMLLHRLDEHLDAGNLHLAELHRQRCTLFGRDAAGAAVGDVAGRVERAEVGADRDVAFLQVEADAGRLECPAADQVLERIVAEQAQVPRAAAGADARQHRNAAAADADLRQRIEIRRVGRFELGLAARLLRQPAQAVADVHDDLGVVLDVQFAGQILNIHAASLAEAG